MKARVELFLFRWVGLGGIVAFIAWHLLSPMWIHLYQHALLSAHSCADAVGISTLANVVVGIVYLFFYFPEHACRVVSTFSDIHRKLVERAAAEEKGE